MQNGNRVSRSDRLPVPCSRLLFSNRLSAIAAPMLLSRRVIECLVSLPHGETGGSSGSSEPMSSRGLHDDVFMSPGPHAS